MNRKEVIELICLSLILHHSKNIAIVLDKHKDVEEFNREFHECYESIPLFLRPVLVRNNIKKKEFENGSRIFLITNTLHFKGLSVDSIFVDDSLSEEKKKDFFIEFFICSSKNGRAVTEFKNE